VLGGTGLTGRATCKALMESGYIVSSISRRGLQEKLREGWMNEINWQAAELGNTRCLEMLDDAELVIHLASSTIPSTSNQDILVDLADNVQATVRVLEQIKHRKVPVVFVSSGGTVYGIPQTEILSEEHPTDPICAYGVHKLAIEKYLGLYSHLYGMASTILRVSNLYGEQQDMSRPIGAISHFVKRAIHGETIEVWGDGTVVRDYIHIDDVVNAIVKSATIESGHSVFNIGSGRGVSLNEILKLIESSLGRMPDVRYSPQRNFDVARNVLNVERAADILKWTSKIPLEEGVARLIRAYQLAPTVMAAI
jgi:UDP-glucose 4-epimerase